MINIFYAANFSKVFIGSFMDYAFCSALEGPDSLADELDLLTKMNIAVQEERYNDAGTWKKVALALL